MSRSGYTEDCDNTWAYIRWRGAVASAIGGKRGQAALREIAAALDAMPVKELAADSLVTTDGMCCTLGALGRARGMDMSSIDPEDRESVAKAFGIAEAMAAEIMYLNDDLTYDHDAGAPARRWKWMRRWVDQQLRPAAGAKDGA